MACLFQKIVSFDKESYFCIETINIKLSFHSMNFVEELKWRGMVHTMMPGTEELFEKGIVTAYLGIDPTADSLHIGHLCGVMMLRTRVIPAFPAAVLRRASRGFASGVLGGYGAVLPVCCILAQGLHKGIVPLRLRHSRLLHRRCVVLGVFAVLAVFAPKGTEESHCVLLSHSSVFYPVT